MFNIWHGKVVTSLFEVSCDLFAELNMDYLLVILMWFRFVELFFFFCNVTILQGFIDYSSLYIVGENT